MSELEGDRHVIEADIKKYGEQSHFSGNATVPNKETDKTIDTPLPEESRG
jgi:hypothetical protein